MKRDTRSEILKEAKKQFNERGFNAVSTGDIAGALQISKGNLTYYFKKKEEIVEAILLESEGGPLPDVPAGMMELNDYFADMQQVVQENAFYFWHHAQLSQLSPKIRERQNVVYQQNTAKLTKALAILQADGMLRKEEYTGEYDHVVDSLLLSSIYWLPFCQLKQEGPSDIGFQSHAWSVLYPLLTAVGRETLKGIMGR